MLVHVILAFPRLLQLTRKIDDELREPNLMQPVQVTGLLEQDTSTYLESV